jgi:quinoprotein glucose dehydrogenase
MKHLFITAFSVHNGAELWRATLPTGARATPMTLQTAAGKQYIVIAAFRLP